MNYKLKNSIDLFDRRWISIIIFKQMARTTLLTLLVTLGAMAAAMAEAFSCPDAACRCGLDGRGRLKAVCDRGELMDPIPVRQMDPLTEVLIISAPQQRPNYLTIGPIFQVNSIDQINRWNQYINFKFKVNKLTN